MSIPYKNTEESLIPWLVQEVNFQLSKEKIYDMKPLINKIKFYEKLKDTEYFKLVKPRYDSVEWPNGEDVCPENLYYDSVDTE